MVLRIGASTILLLSILFMPFWVSVVLAIAGIVYFPFFLEAVGLLLVSDFLYGVKEAKFSGAVFVSFIVSALFFALAEFYKKQLKFYS